MSMTSQPIMIAAGGTGGHMFPAVALANVLSARGHGVIFVTDPRGATVSSDVLGLFGGVARHTIFGAQSVWRTQRDSGRHQRIGARLL